MTLKRDHRRVVPGWLEAINLSKPTASELPDFPLASALERSLYYPASGFDGRPVQFLGGFIHSFIYVDYGFEEKDVDAEMGQKMGQSGFLGYHIAGSKRLNERDLAPNGWSPTVPPTFQDQTKRFADMQARGFVRSPFANWYIFDRDIDMGEDHGPQRFSLLYLCADGVAAYQALYWQNHTAPEVLTIIQPGTGFGGNYTDFRDPVGFFAWTVLHGNVPHLPEYLVCGGLLSDYTQAFWPQAYPEHVEWFQHENGNGVWRRQQASGNSRETDL